MQAQAHRFHDLAALYAGASTTVYMTANEARQLAAGLQKIARSIEREPFTKSGGNTTTVPVRPDSFGFARLERRDDGALTVAARRVSLVEGC